MKYYIEIGTINKAKQDIDEICRREGYCNLTKHNFGNGGVGRFLTKLVSVCSIIFKLGKNDVLLLQYPMKKFYKIACCRKSRVESYIGYAVFCCHQKLLRFANFQVGEIFRKAFFHNTFKQTREIARAKMAFARRH